MNGGEGTARGAGVSVLAFRVTNLSSVCWRGLSFVRNKIYGADG